MEAAIKDILDKLLPRAAELLFEAIALSVAHIAVAFPLGATPPTPTPDSDFPDSPPMPHPHSEEQRARMRPYVGWSRCRDSIFMG